MVGAVSFWVLMEGFSLVEQTEHDLGEKAVPEAEKQVKKGGKVRHNPHSKENKIGRQKFHEVITKRILAQNEQILDELRWMRHRLKALGESDIDVPMLVRYAVVDQVDLEILGRLREVGPMGEYSRQTDDAVNKIGGYGLHRYDVSRRIVRMNKRLHLETGECCFEKRGQRWALTKFAVDVYGASEKDLEEEVK